jgi:hypothetical protein
MMMMMMMIFERNIFNILQSIKDQEEGGAGVDDLRLLPPHK